MPTIRESSHGGASASPTPFDPQPGAAKIRDWVRAAQPNARLVYGHGVAARHAAPDTCDMVMDLAQRGWLTPHFIRGRDGAPDRHIVQRTHRPFLKGTNL